MPSSKKKHAEYLKKRYATDAEYRKKHLARVRKNNKRYAVESKELLKEFKKDGCALCPEKEECCLSAHHLKDKKFSLATGVFQRGPKAVAQELKKCICVCENCHRKIHAGVVKLSLRASGTEDHAGLITR